MMAFANDLVVAVRAGGKILKERRENGSPIVYMPFGSEFSLYMKNLRTQRAVVKVEIDGQDVLGGSSLIINSNSTLDLERFLTDNNKGNRFKFIEKTQQISDFRGDKIDDGIVRITYQFEARPVINRWIHTLPSWPNYSVGCNLNSTLFTSSVDTDGTAGLNTVYGGSTVRSLSNAKLGANGTSGGAGSNGSINCCYNAVLGSNGNQGDPGYSVNDSGITVKGSESNQKFTNGYVGALEYDTHVITFQLRGTNGTEVVVKPITVQMKSQCPTCGKLYRGFPKFCSSCGTAINAEI
jgi:hypothetical protein